MSDYPAIIAGIIVLVILFSQTAQNGLIRIFHGDPVPECVVESEPTLQEN